MKKIILPFLALFILSFSTKKVDENEKGKLSAPNGVSIAKSYKALENEVNLIISKQKSFEKNLKVEKIIKTEFVDINSMKSTLCKITFEANNGKNYSVYKGIGGDITLNKAMSSQAKSSSKNITSCTTMTCSFGCSIWVEIGYYGEFYIGCDGNNCSIQLSYVTPWWDGGAENYVTWCNL